MTCQRIFSGSNHFADYAMINCMAAMPRYDKQSPNWREKSGSYDRCPECGGWKSKKALSCRKCARPRMLQAMEFRWKRGPVSYNASHSRARVRYPTPTECERCGRTAPIERHHIDGDPLNNSRENIAMVCRRCHMEIDGRLENFRTLPRPVRVPPKPCSECGKLAKPLRRGLCHACNERKRRREKKLA